MIEPRPAHPFAWTPQPWGPALQSLPLDPVARHLFTTRDLPLRGRDAHAGWARLADAAGVSPSSLRRLKQVHGAEVVVARPGRPVASTEDGWPRADVIITDDPTVAVAVQVADCVPLLLADPVTRAVAAVHAGWRGTAAGVARVAVAALQSHFGARPADLLAAIGPSIGPCCYQVGTDVLEAFRAAGFREDQLREWFRPDADAADLKGGNAVPREGGARYRLDVPRANAHQLRDAGVDPANIHSCGLCTSCHPSVFPSYRRDGARTGRIAGVIRAR